MISLRDLAGKIGNYFNPQSGTKGFWGSPVAQGMGQAQNTVQQIQTQVPKLVQNVGQQMQKVPDYTFQAPKILGQNIFNTQMANPSSEIVRSMGRGVERIPQRLQGKKFGLGENIEDISNLAMVFPMGSVSKTTSKLPKAQLTKAIETFTHHFQASPLWHDIGTKPSQKVVNEAISFLAGKKILPSMDVYTQNAIKTASFVDLTKKGVLNNAPSGVGLTIKNIREGQKPLVQGGVKITGKELPTTIKTAKIAPKSEQLTIKGSGQPNIPGSPSFGDSIAQNDKDLIAQMTQALKEAQPLRGTQEKLYSQAKSQKLAKMMSARETMAGEKGFFQELGALKGELPKVQYEAIRQKFNQSSVDRLFNMVKQTKNLDEWDKINAQVGLAKILGEKGGGVPTKGEIAKLYEVFGKEFTEALLAKRPLMSKMGELAMQAYNIPRSFMAGIGDLSGTLMQNALFAARHPIVTAKNFVQEVKFFASENAFKMSQQEIASRPTSKLMKQAKVSLTDMGPLVTNREEQFMGNLAEKIPVVGKLIHMTGRAYTGFLNRMRADIFDQMIKAQEKIGGNVKDPAFLKSLGEFINNSTGRGSLGQLERIMPVLGQGLFSARKLVATVQTLNPMYYVNLHPAVRKEALLTMLAFLGGATIITQLAKLNGAEVGSDLTNTDGGKIKLGNTRMNTYGPYQQIAVLMTRLFKGYATSSTTGRKMMLGDPSNPFAPTRFDLLTRYFESKEHPTLSLITSVLRGQNAIGQPLNLPAEVLNRFIPMVLADSYDLWKEHGPIGFLGTIPTILGIPTQTYGNQFPTIKTTPTGRQNIQMKPVPGIGEDIVSKITNTPASNIPESEWPAILEAKKKELEQEKIKDQVKMTSAPVAGNGVYTYIEDGDVKTIPLDNTVEEPTLTGDEGLDKKINSEYNSKITKATNNIFALYQHGQLTKEEASKQLAILQKQSDATKPPKKPAKVTIAKLSAPKVKTLKISKAKLPKVKIAKTPTLKTSKPVKIGKFKPKGIKVKITKKPTLG